MKIEGTPKEIADLVKELQGQHKENSLYNSGPPMNIVNHNHGFRSSGGGSYSELKCFVSVENFGVAVEAISDIKNILSDICSIIKN